MGRGKHKTAPGGSDHTVEYTTVPDQPLAVSVLEDASRSAIARAIQLPEETPTAAHFGGQGGPGVVLRPSTRVVGGPRQGRQGVGSTSALFPSREAALDLRYAAADIYAPQWMPKNVGTYTASFLLADAHAVSALAAVMIKADNKTFTLAHMSVTP